MSQKITVRLVVHGEKTATFTRAEYDRDKARGDLGLLLDWDASTLHGTKVVVEPGGAVLHLDGTPVTDADNVVTAARLAEAERRYEMLREVVLTAPQLTAAQWARCVAEIEARAAGTDGA